MPTLLARAGRWWRRPHPRPPLPAWLLPTWLWAPDPMRDRAAGRPRVLLSVDRRFIHRIGFTRLTFHRLLRWAGARVRETRYWADPEIEGPAVGNSDGKDGNDAKAQSRWAERIAALMEDVDGVVLSGGGDVDPRLYGVEGPAQNVNPARDRFELAVIAACLERGLPILAICRGSQLLNVALGGTLKSLRGDAGLYRTHNNCRGMHRVALRRDTRLAEAVAPHTQLLIRSVHGQCVDRVAEGMEMAAMSLDGTIEAIASCREDREAGGEEGDSGEGGSGREHDGDVKDDSDRGAGLPWLVGVQWHPELTFFRNNEHELVRAFVREARARRLMR